MPALLRVTAPHAVYDLRADDVARGRTLDHARATGFRYPVQAANQPVAAAEVHVDSGGRANLVANINYGPFVGATERAFARLAKSAEVADQSYEARVLRCSAIPVLAIWLKADDDGPDWIYPLVFGPAGVRTEQLCGVDDFLHAIRPIAQQRSTGPRPPAAP